MQDDTGDLIPPASFLYIAERLDLVQEVDRWVVGQAIDLLEAESDAGRERVVEVNVSGRSIGDPELLESIVNIARGLGKQTIAEFVGDDETVEALRHLGVNFGQGFYLGRPGPLERAFAVAPGNRADGHLS